MRQRAVVILINRDEGKILLIRRIREKREYYVIPGGAMEKGEDREEAAVREMKEETGLDIELGKKIFKYHNDWRGELGEVGEEYYFLAEKYSGNLALGGPEKEIENDENQYHLEWVPFQRIKNIPLVPRAVKEFLVGHLLS